MTNLAATNKHQPYSEYQDSGVAWLGRIPEEWGVLPLRRVIDRIEDGGTPSRSDPTNFEGPINWLVVDDIADEITSTKETITEKGLRESNAKVWNPGDIILTFGATIGEVGIARISLTTKQGIAGIHIKKESLIEKYLFYYLKILKPYLNEIAVGTTIFEVRPPRLKTVPVPLPPIPDQQKIVGYLDKKVGVINAAIAAKRRQVELLREHRSALIHHAVTKGLDPSAELIDSGIPWLGRIPKGSEALPLRFCLARNDGGVWGEDDLLGTGRVVLRSTEITKDGEWDLSQAATRKITAEEYSSAKLLVGDLLLTKSSGSAEHLGKTAIVTKAIEDLGCAYSNFMQRMRVNERLQPRYLFYLINGSIGREQINYWGLTTSGLVNLTAGLVGKFTFPVPALRDQQKITGYLDEKTSEIDLTMSKIERSINLLTELRSSLIHSAVTGKIMIA